MAVWEERQRDKKRGNKSHVKIQTLTHTHYEKYEKNILVPPGALGVCKGKVGCFIRLLQYTYAST